jgi:hypothetical protein
MRTRLRTQFPANREINRGFRPIPSLNSYFDGQYASVLESDFRYTQGREQTESAARPGKPPRFM